MFEVECKTVLKRLSQQAYQNNIKQYSQLLPTLSFDDSIVVQGLQKNGIFITTLEQLAIPYTSNLIKDTHQIIPSLLTSLPNHSSTYMIKASCEKLMEFSCIFEWGLQKRILQIAEQYIKLPVAYHGVYFRRDLANNVEKKTRLWHLDKEDRRMLKIIIYLNEVTPDIGPFQYIPKYLTDSIFQELRYNYSYVQEQRMQQVIPKTQWKSCYGSAGTVIFVDPACVFHRGKKPINSDRLTVFFDYTSRIPKHPYYCKSPFSPKQLSTLCDSLSQSQKECVFWRKS
ncbi:MAG: 2OG-Fe(II) oxygenase [Limnoraphis sp.]